MMSPLLAYEGLSTQVVYKRDQTKNIVIAQGSKHDVSKILFSFTK